MLLKDMNTKIKIKIKNIKERQKETTEKRKQYKIKILNAIYVIRAVIIARIVPFLSKQKDI